MEQERTNMDAPMVPRAAQPTLSETIHLGARSCLQLAAAVSRSDETCDLGNPLTNLGQIAVDPHSKDSCTLPTFDEKDLDNPEFLSAAAAEIYRMRRARDHVLPSDLTGEPAWDMLLALLSEEPARMTVSSVCYGSGVPQSTALRWISMLEQKDLVQRVEHPRDKKMVLLSLTDHGREVIGDALKAMLRAFRF